MSRPAFVVVDFAGASGLALARLIWREGGPRVIDAGDRRARRAIAGVSAAVVAVMQADDGIGAALARLRGEVGHDAVRAVAIADANDTRAAGRAALAGVDVLLLRPFSPLELQHEVERAASLALEPLTV
jgi:CheY-like chemotaxis protein